MIKRYKTVLMEIKAEVGTALTELYPHKSLWAMSELDQLRLVKLKLWSERYSVSLTYLLTVLFDYYYAGMKNKEFKRRALKSKGLGLRVATLTGNVSESLLKESIEKNFPDNENVAVRKEDHRDEILEFLDQELPSKHKSVLSYNRVTDFVTAYRHKLDRRKHDSESISRKLSKQPWRGNPFR